MKQGCQCVKSRLDQSSSDLGSDLAGVCKLAGGGDRGMEQSGSQVYHHEQNLKRHGAPDAGPQLGRCAEQPQEYLSQGLSGVWHHPGLCSLQLARLFTAALL